MDVGTFCVALTVKNIQISKAFYEKLGFVVFRGVEAENWLIMKNGEHHIGLFQGVFDKNMLTFQPTDVRSIQKHLKASGISLITEADETTTGPAHITLKDPDGNDIMFDQF